MAAAAFVAVAVGAAPSAAAATSERILFQSDRDGNWELYAMNADGSSPTRLTFDPHADVDPTTSASGARIAFARGRFTADHTELMKIPFMLVIGEREMNEEKISVRRQGKGDLGSESLEEFIVMINKEVKSKKGLSES